MRWPRPFDKARSIHYLEKPLNLADLLATLKEAARTRPQPVFSKSKKRPTPRHTHRRTEILRMLSQGMTNREIGCHLELKEKTIAINITALLRILGAKNCTDAVAKARFHGLLL